MGLSEPDFLGDVVSLPYRIRSPFVALERGVLRVEDHCLFLDQGSSEGIEIPVGMVSSLLLWVGEAGVRVYSAGLPGGKHGQRIVKQVLQHVDSTARMLAARRLYRLMFDEDMPETRSLEKLRGFEGCKVKALYAKLAAQYDVPWKSRDSAPAELKDALGIATSCLYGLAEAVILAAGFSPAIGVVHSGDPRSLVFDLADTVKFSTVVPVGFRIFKESSFDTKNRARRACRDVFREHNTTVVLFQNLYAILGDDVVGSSPQ